VTGEPAVYPLSGGWLRAVEARIIVSPNADARPPGCQVDLLVIHNISLPPGQFMNGAVERLFTNALDLGAHPYYAHLAGLKVSAHFLIDRLGGLTQFVSTDQRAWHAGASTLDVDGVRRERCNDFSIGVELEGCDDLAYSQMQYQRLAALTRTLREHYPIAHVRGHNEIAPGRKTDPGAAFDWQRYFALAGLPPGARPGR
jgi:AmpD protein